MHIYWKEFLKYELLLNYIIKVKLNNYPVAESNKNQVASPHNFHMICLSTFPG